MSDGTKGERMELKEYFENTRGIGVLSTADSEGKVDAAIYSRPHVLEDGMIAFVMRERLTHHNLQSNPHAVYLFIEEGPGFGGLRLFLTKRHTAHRRTQEAVADSRRGQGERTEVPCHVQGR